MLKLSGDTWAKIYLSETTIGSLIESGELEVAAGDAANAARVFDAFDRYDPEGSCRASDLAGPGSHVRHELREKNLNIQPKGVRNESTCQVAHRSCGHLAGRGSAATASTVELTDAEVENLVKRSYQYVAMYNVNNKFAIKNGGWNTIDADTRLKDHTMREIARPNNDTLYFRRYSTCARIP